MYNNNNYISQINVCKHKQIKRAESAGVEYSDNVCLYFHEPSYYSSEKTQAAIEKYKETRSLCIRKVVCVLYTGEVYEFDV